MDRGRDSRDRNDRNNERDRNTGCQRSRDGDRDRDRDRDRGSGRDRQYTLTQRPGKQFNISLNKQVMRISDTRELCDFVSTHAAEFNQVTVATTFRQVLKKPMGIPPKALAQTLQALKEFALQNMQERQQKRTRRFVPLLRHNV